MAWKCIEQTTIKRNGEYVLVKYGDLIPEADSWPNVSSYIRTGFLKKVPDVRAEALPIAVSDEHRIVDAGGEAENRPEPLPPPISRRRKRS